MGNIRMIRPALAALVLLLGPAAAVEKEARPNILLIFADDLGWKDTGYHGSDFYETPHLDRLRQEGMDFPNAYAAAGNCAPSRACLISGTYTPRHHVYAVGSTDRGPKKSQRLIPIPNKSGLAPGCATLAEALKSGDYATGIFGKWHLDGKDGAEAAQQGFDTVFDPRPNPNQKQNEPADPKGAFSITRAAGEFMEKSIEAKQPFFAYVSHHAIHGALEARPESLARFTAKARGKQHSHPLYAACIHDLDAAVGQLLAKVESLGIADNTLVVFTSDNGATQQSSQEPLRGSKGGYYEGGIREPFLVRWPGKIKPASRNQTPVINVDLFPTFLAAAGISKPDGLTLDGESLLPLFESKGELKRQSIYWHFPGYLDTPVIRGRKSDIALGFRSRPVSVIRKGDWKLHLFHEEWQLDGGRENLPANHAVELYNLKSDEGERHDRSATETAKRDELLEDLLRWIKQTGAFLPSERNPGYQESPASGKATKQ
jgi:arylsulfatase A-like enzyme